MNDPKTSSGARIGEIAASAAACETQVLPSGLTVLCRTMPGYSTVHAMYAANFGSVNRRFSLDGTDYALPAGTAHFLEHKMFEKESGDAFDLYAKTGASANAFTGYDRTCYLFSATRQFDENLDILLGMIAEPYFTKATIAKEQGIIGQEIKMYDDNPDWRLLTALFQALYREHPLRDDIAGTVESIASLTPELLYACTRAFYRPGNMLLSVAGNVTMAQVLDACARAGLDRPAPSCAVEQSFPDEREPVRRQDTRFTMPVAKPCFALGFREEPLAEGDIAREILCDMLPELIVGGMTPLYRKLYDEALVNPDFGGDYISAPGCCAIAFTGESAEPEKVTALLRAEIERIRREGVDRELFTLNKNQMYGELLSDLECVEDTAGEMAAAALKGRTLAQEIGTLAALTAEDADRALQSMLLPQNSAYVQIDPQ